MYMLRGGLRRYAGYNGTTGEFTPESKTGAQLVRTSSSSYERRLPDGSKHVYAQSDGASSGSRRVFLSKVVDSTGNAISLEYDAQMRLTGLVDAIGQRTQLRYGDSQKPLLLTGVTDPFGRSSEFAYDASGRFNSLTDAIGMKSNFEYDATTFIKSMTTPYGVTTFSYGENGTTRWLEITDPKGEKERVEYSHGAAGIPFTESQVPGGVTSPFNTYISARNTYYWDKATMRAAAGDYAQARIKHWVHGNDGNTTGVLESIKSPLESRVWYSYPGQTWGAGLGTFDKPSYIGRVLPDGATQATWYSYNSAGNVTQETLPSGLVTTYEYAPNQIDVLKITRKNGTSPVVIAEFTYNSLHVPLTFKNADGQTTVFTYNGRGQRTSETAPKGELTRYEYDSKGYLTTVIAPDNKARARYTYDAVGRMASRTNAVGFAETFTYDALNRVTRIDYSDGSKKEYVWDKLDIVTERDQLGRETRYTWDAARQLTGKTNPAGQVLQYNRDPDGRLISVTAPNAPVQTFAYDRQGRKISESRGNEFTQYEFDTAGRMTRATYPDGNNVMNRYDVANRLIESSDSRGNTTKFTLDPAGNRTRVDVIDGAGAVSVQP